MWSPIAYGTLAASPESGAYADVPADGERVLQLRAPHATPCRGRVLGVARTALTPGTNHTLVLAGRTTGRPRVDREPIVCTEGADASCIAVPVTARGRSISASDGLGRRSRAIGTERARATFLRTARGASEGRGMRARALAALALGAAALALAPLGARADLEPIAYTVVRGDTASRIASRHGLTLEELSALNDRLEVDRLRAGQQLVIGRGRLVEHRVRPRETLTAIAERYGVRVEEIVRWNAGLDAQRVMAGRELRVWARRDEPQSISRGRVDRGALVHGVSLPSHPGYVVRDAQRAWVTRQVAEHLAQGFDAVLARDPDAPRVQIRDASRPEGGRLRRHHSHQSGRDVDLVYYQRRCPNDVCSRRWMRPEQLDAQLQWALLERWIRSGAVEYVFIDYRLQEPLWQAAREAGATRAELAAWFQWPRARHVRAGIIRHVPRHAEHLHVRFVCAANDTDCVPSAAGRD